MVDSAAHNMYTLGETTYKQIYKHPTQREECLIHPHENVESEKVTKPHSLSNGDGQSPELNKQYTVTYEKLSLRFSLFYMAIMLHN